MNEEELKIKCLEISGNLLCTVLKNRKAMEIREETYKQITYAAKKLYDKIKEEKFMEAK